MKKLFIVILTIILLLNLSSCAYVSTEKRDSTNVEKDVKSELNAGLKTVVRVYWGGLELLDDFAASAPLEKLLEDSEEIYCTLGLSKKFYKIDAENEVTSFDTKKMLSKHMAFDYVLHPRKALGNISPFIKVDQVYYFMGAGYSSYVYYVTDRGNYILFIPSAYKSLELKDDPFAYKPITQLFLFPADNLADNFDVWVKMVEYSDYGRGCMMVGGRSFGNRPEHAKYKIKPYLGDWIFGVSIVIIFAAIISITVIKKKRNKQRSLPPQTPPQNN